MHGCTCTIQVCTKKAWNSLLDKVIQIYYQGESFLETSNLVKHIDFSFALIFSLSHRNAQESQNYTFQWYTKNKQTIISNVCNMKRNNSFTR